LSAGNTAMKNSKIVSENEAIDLLIKSYDRFVPYQIHDLLGKKRIEEVHLGDQKEFELTILFSDIRDFTAISESLRPKENFDFINAYLNRMDPIINKHQGIINKFLGDGIMAVFPTDADEAVTCSIQMVKQLEQFNRDRANENQLPVKIGIGLNTGLCMVGIVGDLNRMEATVISDAVNIAAHLESLTKKYKVPILISEVTLSSLKDTSGFSIRIIDRVKVKSKKLSLSVYEVYDPDPAEVKALKDKTKVIFEEAVACYHYRKIEVAVALFEKCIELNPQDLPARIYLERCHECTEIRHYESAQEVTLQQIAWSHEFEIGEETIDKQHYDLYTFSMKLLNAVSMGLRLQEIEEITNYLGTYVLEHFQTEEGYMLAHHYPFYDHQKGQHAHFVKSFELVKQEIQSASKSKTYLMFRIQTLVIDWLINHTLKEDRHFGKYIKGKEYL
jgi:hemerythrin-like metal-binding protein